VKITLTLLLLSANILIPIPRQVTSNRTDTSDHIQKKADAKKTPAQPATALPENAPDKSNPTNPHGDNPSPNDHETTVSVRKLPSVSIAKDWTDWVSIVCTGALALVGFLGIYAAFKTLGEIKEQNKSFTSKERARISIAVNYEGFFDGNPSGTYAEVGVDISQLGPTHAFNVRGAWNVVVSASKNRPPIEQVSPMKLPTTLKAAANTVQESLLMPELSSDLLEDLRDEKRFLHLFGHITYEDVFGRKRRTTFRYIWNVNETTVDEGTVDNSGWEFNGPPEDNEAT
jgi:hypothetical protein